MKFRLGWSMIRAKQDVELGIKYMEEASTIILNNIEILLKIAGAYLSELPDTLENNNKIIGLTETICQIDPVKCFEALIIKGKVLHRMG